jgi:hypothetical protein
VVFAALGSSVCKVGDIGEVRRSFEHGRTAMFSKNSPVGDW